MVTQLSTRVECTATCGGRAPARQRYQRHHGGSGFATCIAGASGWYPAAAGTAQLRALCEGVMIAGQDVEADWPGPQTRTRQAVRDE